MIKLSVNINKVATIRNARGTNHPDVLAFALNCERFGADGITVHPRSDARHIKRADVLQLGANLSKPFNIEGFPDRRYLELVAKVRPTLATLVPDLPDAITSSAGWDTRNCYYQLRDAIEYLKGEAIPVSIFIAPDVRMIDHARLAGAQYIEFYTEPFASQFESAPEKAIASYIEAAKEANRCGLKINAGHDLNLKNLAFFAEHLPDINEVSIGHALICDALYYGLENTIGMYKQALQTGFDKAQEKNKE